jgi:sortase A
MKTPMQRQSVTLAVALLALVSLAIAVARPGPVLGGTSGSHNASSVRPAFIPSPATQAKIIADASGGATAVARLAAVITARPTATATAPAAGALTLVSDKSGARPVAAVALAASPRVQEPVATQQPAAPSQPSPTAAAQAAAPTPQVAPLAGASKAASSAVAAAPTPTSLPATQAPTATVTAVPPTPAPTATTAPAAPPPAPAPAPQVPSRIVAKSIGLDVKIIPVGWREVTNKDGSKTAEWIVANYAASWHKTSAKLGEIGNTVLTGHNNIVGEVFRHLEDFKIGDLVTIYGGNQAFQYKVAEKFIVQEVGVPYSQRLENAKWIDHFDDERVTLMSCWPYTGDSHRIFVILRPAN